MTSSSIVLKFFLNLPKLQNITWKLEKWTKHVKFMVMLQFLNLWEIMLWLEAWCWKSKVRRIFRRKNYFATFISLNFFTGGEYRLLPYRIEKEPFCQFCKNDKYVYQSLAKNSDFPTDVDANCPLKPVSNIKFFFIWET